MKFGNSMIVSMVTIALFVTAGVARSDDDLNKQSLREWLDKSSQNIEPVEFELYVTECGGCHFPYQPGLLPASSWEQIMRGLVDHFGENAELRNKNFRAIQNYLLNNSAGRTNYGLPNKLMAIQAGHLPPVRITEMRYFISEHEEIPRSMVQDNPEVKSFSNCDSCNQKAQQGLYDKSGVHIPGFGS